MNHSRRAIYFVLLAAAVLAGAAFLSGGAAAQPKQAANNDYLSGTFYAHDLYEIFDGRQELGRGFRIFNDNGVMNRLGTYPDSAAMNYEVETDATFRLFTDAVSLGFGGTVGLRGQLAVFTREAGPNEDAQVRDGYASLQVSVGQTSGRRNRDFNGMYSFHGLLRDSNDRYGTSFGLAESEGGGNYILVREDRVARTYSYRVESDGRIRLGRQEAVQAALLAGGGLIVNTAELGPGDDAEISGGYSGLALYLRRFRNDTATTDHFLGTYRVHRITANGSTTARTGTITAGGNGFFFGTAGGIAREGQIALNGSGTFTLVGSDVIQGTLGEGGGIAVITTTPGNTPALEIWVRTAGGPGNAIDRDGDGVPDDEEAALGTDPDNRDTDGDGLLDNADPRPLIPDNIVEAQLSESAVTAEIGGPAITDVTLDLDSNDFPFFEWALASDVPWLTFDQVGGAGDRTVNLHIDVPSLTIEDSPHTANIAIDAPAMDGTESLALTVTIASPQVDLELDPDTIALTVVEGGLAASADVEITSPDGGDFAWHAETEAPWMTISPAEGSGPGTATIEVDPADLLAEESPYTGSAIFIPGAGGPKEFPVAVTAQVVPPRELGVPFPVAASDVAQARPAAAFHGSAGVWLLAWVEEQQIRAALYDARLTPLTQPVRLSLAVQGTATNPTAVAVEDEDEIWVFWEQFSESSSDAFIQGRTFDLATRAAGNVFGFSTGAGDKSFPRATYNQAANEVAVTFGQEFGSDTFLGLVRLDGSSRDTLSTGFAAANDDIQRSPDLDWLADTNEYLLAWRETVVETVEGEEVITTQVRARRLAGNTGRETGNAIVVAEDAPGAENIRVLAITESDRWVVLWSESSGALRSAAVHADGSPGPVHTLDTRQRAGRPLAAGYNGASKQSIVLWNGGAGDNPAAVYRTIAGSGQALGDTTPLPDNPGATSSAAAGANAGDNEFLLVWEDPGTIPRQLTGLRLDGGSDDVDGDGLPNDWEIQFGLDPNSAEGDDGADGDPDRDGLSNLAEYMLGTDPTNPDTDGDGLLDGQEDRNGNGVIDDSETSPLNPDTDGDGVTDDVEWFLGSDGTDPESTPDTGIYRVDYGTWTPRVPGELTVSFYIAESGRYALQVNPEAGEQQAAPEGWTLESGDAGDLVEYEPGAHHIEYTITPGPDLTPETAYATFRFVLVDASDAIASSNPTVLVADRLQTFPDSGETTAESLARAHAPVLRLHRDAVFAPMPVEVSLESATFDTGNTITLPAAPQAIDLYQSPNADAYMDLPGTDAEALFAAYPEPDDLPEPALYYTVTPLGDTAAADGAGPDHVAIQYYLHFFADLWGLDQTGGHRHEGDWEVFQVLLDAEHTPYRATATQQWQLALENPEVAGGESRPWARIEVMGGGRPVVYVGQGGHSLYFEPGATRYPSGVELHDGLGAWLVPADASGPLVTTDYGTQLPLNLLPLARLSDPEPTRWLRFAGRWGQPNYPIPADDSADPAVNNGPTGPAFLGTSRDPDDPAGVPRIYADPWAFATRTPEVPEPAMTNVRGIILGTEFWEKTLMLLDARGRIYTTEITAGNGSFDLEVPVQNYLLAAVELREFARPVLLAAGRFHAGSFTTPLFPATPGITAIGVLELEDGFLTGPANFPFHDTDGDGIPDSEDPDIDGDGIPNGDDDDVLGDGWADAFQAQDPNGNGIPKFLDPDDGPDPDGPADTDGDGFIDAIDLDIDNDGFDNATEIAAGSDPRHFLDTPFQRVGDINSDGEINAVDGQLLVNMALGRIPFSAIADFNLNGLADAGDLQALINVILEGAPDA